LAESVFLDPLKNAYKLIFKDVHRRPNFPSSKRYKYTSPAFVFFCFHVFGLLSNRQHFLWRFTKVIIILESRFGEFSGIKFSLNIEKRSITASFFSVC